MSTFKPNLASAYDPQLLRFPVLASPKLDGIRALAKQFGTERRLVSRKLLNIPNKHIFSRFGPLAGLDGELILGDPWAPDVYRRTNSAVMSIEGTPEITYWVFDLHDMEDSPYEERYAELQKIAEPYEPFGVKVLPQTLIHNMEMLEAFEEEHVAIGYEGIMIRDPKAPYKYGRSTAKEGGLLKVKRFDDSEAYVIDIVEEQFNGNEAGRDELGRTKRSSAVAGKIGKATMGALRVVDVTSGVDFHVGSGFTANERLWWWQNKAAILARSARTLIKYKFFAVGVKDRPRHPVFAGLRSEIDL